MPLVSATQATDVILTHIKDVWEAQTPPIPALYYDDVDDDLPGGDVTWARVMLQDGPVRAISLAGVGDRKFTRSGIVTIEIYTPVGDGRTAADLYKEVAWLALEGVTAGGPDQVWFRNVGADGGLGAGKYQAWRITRVLADYLYDRVK